MLRSTTTTCGNLWVSKTMAIEVIRLEYHEGTSSKYYELQYTASGVYVHWGRIGTRGAFQPVSESEARKRHVEKLAKGYVEVGRFSVGKERSITIGTGANPESTLRVGEEVEMPWLGRVVELWEEGER